MSEAELPCREVVEVVSAYLDGSLAETDRRRFEAHLDECPYCVRYVEQMRTIARRLGDLREEAIAPEQRDALVAAFRGWRER